ncbi:cell division protein FtsQ/DivIB [Sandaracinobacteroides sp. A072]|uniref:cell division protein FtsQ/DivIB n=1 Tax=Sandaracinobacteroides sp. A072 TaxID=3461146 RepID=UPI004041362F
MSRANPRARGGSARRSQRQPTPMTVPVAPRTMWRLILTGFGGLGLAAAIIWAIVADLPQKTMLSVATSASSAGFVVRQVDISGASNQPRLDIYRQILYGGSDSMLLTDLVAMRERLLELPWVRDASLYRRWPDRIEVRIAERKPAALWQHQGRITLIDAEGVTLPTDDIARFSTLPLLVGADAHENARELLRILAAQPALAGEVEAALRIGQRRWDLRMKSGETISLPEGPEAHAALVRFASIHQQTPLLGQGFLRFDLRIPDKMVVRVTGEAGARARPALPPQAAPQTAPAAPGANAVHPDAVRPVPQPQAGAGLPLIRTGEAVI